MMSCARSRACSHRWLLASLLVLMVGLNAAPSFAQSSIPMLPATGCAQGTNGVLTWDYQSAIKCAPGVTATTNNISVGSGSSGSLTLGSGSTAATATTATITSANNLESAAACATNQALTKNASGKFTCIAVTDITGVGTTTVPSCPSKDQLYFTGSGFTCVALPTYAPMPPACSGTDFLQSNGSSFSCAGLPSSGGASSLTACDFDTPYTTSKAIMVYALCVGHTGHQLRAIINGTTVTQQVANDETGFTNMTVPVPAGATWEMGTQASAGYPCGDNGAALSSTCYYMPVQ